MGEMSMEYQRPEVRFGDWICERGYSGSLSGESDAEDYELVDADWW